MHIPDGMLSVPVMAASGATSVGCAAYAVRWARRHLDPERVVLMSVMAALVFALQMLNFPVAAGTSGHFAGGAAAAILLGPWPAALVLITVLAVQALLFGDGGVLAFGANVLNLAIVAPLVGYAVWRGIRRTITARSGAPVAAFAAAWVAVVASAVLAGVEIWLSGVARLGLIVSAMGAWHAIIGIGEGAITAGLVAYVLNRRPDLVASEAADRPTSGRPVAIALGGVAVLAAAASWLASSHPDGLEAAMRDTGIAVPAVPSLRAVLADYALPGVNDDRLATALAGFVGLVVVAALLYSLFSKGATKGAGEVDEHGEEV